MRSGFLVAAGLTMLWNVLRDARARSSVKRAAQVTKSLASQALSVYMDPMAGFDTEEAAKYNRQWVEQQWRNIGY